MADIVYEPLETNNQGYGHVLDDITVKGLVSRNHEPKVAESIYNDKVQYRPVLLRPSFKSGKDGRLLRRQKRDERLSRGGKKRKPKPLTAAEKRNLGLHKIGDMAFKDILPLHEMWREYIRDILTTVDPAMASQKILKADFHGAYISVQACTCPNRVGLRGLCVKETKNALYLVTFDNKTKSVPKEGTAFLMSLRLPESTDSDVEEAPFSSFLLYGSQLRHSPASRATHKFKAKPTVKFNV